MRFDWLNEMVNEGLIREAAAQTIMEDCRGFAKEADAGEAVNMADLAKDIGTGIAGGAGMFLFDKLMRVGFRKWNMRSDLNSMRETKNALLKDPQLAANKGKAEARFRELIQYAPALAADQEKALRVVKQHIDKGFSESDIEKLRNLQMMMGGGATSAGSDASYGSVFDYENELKNKMLKEGSAAHMMEPKVAEHLGKVAFDIYHLHNTAMTKEANIFGRVGKYLKGKYQAAGRLGDIAALSLMTAAIPMGAGAIAGTANYVKDKIDQRDFKDKLEKSFSTALKESDPEKSLIRQNPNQARKAFETLVHFSPSVAAEPRAARTFMEKMLGYEGTVQPSDIKDLVEIERNFKQTANKMNPFFSAFSSTGKIMGMDKAMSQGMSAASKPYFDEQEQHIRGELGLPSAFDAKIEPPVGGGA